MKQEDGQERLVKGVWYKGVSTMARRLGISRVYLSYILHGKCTPTAGIAERMARMGIDVESLKGNKKTAAR